MNTALDYHLIWLLIYNDQTSFLIGLPYLDQMPLEFYKTNSKLKVHGVLVSPRKQERDIHLQISSLSIVVIQRQQGDVSINYIT